MEILVLRKTSLKWHPWTLIQDGFKIKCSGLIGCSGPVRENGI